MKTMLNAKTMSLAFAAMLGLNLFFTSCNKEKLAAENVRDTSMRESKSIETFKRGFNTRWRNLPAITPELIAKIRSLKPQVLRYPGGTFTHNWDWRTGMVKTGFSVKNDTKHPITDVKLLADASNSQPIFVLDIVNSSLEDQIEMLDASGVKVKYVEMGNEIYSPDYETQFPTGAAYALKVNEWASALKAKYKGIKIGVVMIGRKGGGRQSTWNADVLSTLHTSSIDAFVYHIYVDADETIDERMARFDEVFVPNTGKDLWMTEYGARSESPWQSLQLAQRIESIADIALNHAIVTGAGDFTKFLLPAFNYTDQGKLFQAKVYDGLVHYRETFESPSGNNAYLSSIMGYNTLPVNQTVNQNTLIRLSSGAALYADSSTGTLGGSDNGLSYFYNGQASGYGLVDNVIITPALDSVATADFSMDIAYLQGNQNNAVITFYWSTSYDGSSPFNEADWHVFGTETVANMKAEGITTNGQYKRENLQIQPYGKFQVAMRITQDVTPVNYRTQWRFDNIKISNF